VHAYSLHAPIRNHTQQTLNKLSTVSQSHLHQSHSFTFLHAHTLTFLPSYIMTILHSYTLTCSHSYILTFCAALRCAALRCAALRSAAQRISLAFFTFLHSTQVTKSRVFNFMLATLIPILHTSGQTNSSTMTTTSTLNYNKRSTKRPNIQPFPHSHISTFPHFLHSRIPTISHTHWGKRVHLLQLQQNHTKLSTNSTQQTLNQLSTNDHAHSAPIRATELIYYNYNDYTKLQQTLNQTPEHVTVPTFTHLHIPASPHSRIPTVSHTH